MKKISNFLFIVFSGIFFIIFLLMLAKGVGFFDRAIAKDIFIFSIILTPLLFFLLRWFLNRYSISINIKFFSIFFFITVFTINLICALRLSNAIQPVSDFELAYNKAINFTTNTQYDLYYPWWTNFSILLNFIFKIFGSNLVVVAVMNSILSTLSCVFVFALAKKHLKFKDFWAFLPALFFALYPSRLFFLPFVAPDFIAEFGFILVTYLFFNYLDSFTRHSSSKKLPFYSLSIALLVAFFSLFKPMQEIFFVLFLIILVIKSLPNFREYFKKVVYFVVIFLCVILSANFIHAKFFEAYTHIKLDKSLILTNKLYVGLNSQGKGYWNPVNEQYIDYLEKKYGSDTHKIAHAMQGRLIQDIKQNSHFWEMLIKKLDTAFISDFYGIEWINISLKSGRIDLSDLERPVYMSNLYYYFILCFALIGVFGITKYKDLKKLYFVVFILGFVAIVVIGESQTRYKLAFLFNLIFLASIGIKNLADYPIRQKIKKFIE